MTFEQVGTYLYHRTKCEMVGFDNRRDTDPQNDYDGGLMCAQERRPTGSEPRGQQQVGKEKREETGKMKPGDRHPWMKGLNPLPQ